MEPAEWPDSGLGCPQPGQLYLQMITPGWLIEVQGGGKIFEYHTDSDDRFVLCAERRRDRPSGGVISPNTVVVMMTTPMCTGLIPPTWVSLMVASKFVGAPFHRATFRSFPLYIVFFLTMSMKMMRRASREAGR